MAKDITDLVEQFIIAVRPRSRRKRAVIVWKVMKALNINTLDVSGIEHENWMKYSDHLHMPMF